MSETPKLLEQAFTVLGLKEAEQKKQRLDGILKNLIVSAVHTGVLDLTPYLVGGFLSAINDEVATANMMKQTVLLQAIPDFQDKETLDTFIGKRQVKVDVPKLQSESDDISQVEETVEVTVTYDLNLFVEIGNRYHSKAQAEPLTANTAYGSLKRVLEWVALPGDKVL